jgi:two-component system phosphate regulon response regulator PhoB
MEDDRYLGEELVEELEGAGYEVAWGHDGEEGLELIAQDMPDLVLLDLMMPKITGVEVLKRLKKEKKTRDLTVITLSNLAGAGDARYVKSLGAVAHLVKGDLDLEDIVKAVGEYLKD